MSLGNDVVDLDDPETRLEGLHPRWGERVFTAGERAALAASPQRRRLHWALWAAKESAYKARKRLAPGTVFAPKEFAVDLARVPSAATGVVGGQVVHRGDTFDLEIRIDRESVHAVAWSRGGTSGPLLSGLAKTDRDPSLAARRLAATTIGSILGLDPAAVEIVDRPPVAVHRSRRLDAGLSLSHHGRFVAFACRLDPRLRRGRARPGLFVFTFSRATLSPEDQPVRGEPFVFTQFAGEPQCFLTEAQLREELLRAGFEEDSPGPLTEYNRPVPGRTLTRGSPVIYEGTFRAVRRS